MPASVHKILIHGAKTIVLFVIPIGKLFEETQKARKKDFKLCRDLLYFLLVYADPYLVSLKNVFLKTESPLLPEAQALLLYLHNNDS